MVDTMAHVRPARVTPARVTPMPDVVPGHRRFADALTALAAGCGDRRLSALAAAITAPLRVAVAGRRGTGRRTTAAALAAAGACIAEQHADLVVYVVAEAFKPEDLAAISGVHGPPVLVVMNKSDLGGHLGLPPAHLPVERMSALFALAALGGGLDIQLWQALGDLAGQPHAQRSLDGGDRVPPQVRERLCTAIDLSGIEALRELAGHDGSLAQARALLNRLSGITDVTARLEAMGACTYHRRMSEAVIRLEAIAVADSRVDEFLVGDATVFARAAAAAAALDVPDEPALAQARRWQSYRQAPLGPAASACAADLARASLRTWAAQRSRC